MNAEAFFDTNVLLYLIGSDQRKADCASELLASGGIISVQVLNEFANVACREAGLDWPELRETLAVFRAVCEVRAVTIDTHDRAIDIASRHRMSVYDALILAAAVEAGCGTLWSEDMQDGQRIDTLTISNPFAIREAD
jgi:predicted nucleic acid-binding protein